MSVTQQVALTSAAFGSASGGYKAYRRGQNVVAGVLIGGASGYLITLSMIKAPWSAWIILPSGAWMMKNDFLESVERGQWDVVGLDIATLVTPGALAQWGPDYDSLAVVRLHCRERQELPQRQKVKIPLPGLSGTSADIAVIGSLADTAPYRGQAGFKVLDILNWTPERNDSFIASIIQNRQTVRLASPVMSRNLWDPVAARQTVFAREINQLIQAGYQIVGDFMVPP